MVFPKAEFLNSEEIIECAVQEGGRLGFLIDDINRAGIESDWMYLVNSLE
jgi:hypothetical protein